MNIEWDPSVSATTNKWIKNIDNTISDKEKLERKEGTRKQTK